MSLPNPSIDVLYLRIAPADIAFIKFIFESYEEVGLIRTIDRHAAVIVLLVVPDFLPVARAILDDLRRSLDFVEMGPPTQDPDDWLMREIDDAE